MLYMPKTLWLDLWAHFKVSWRSVEIPRKWRKMYVSSLISNIQLSAGGVKRGVENTPKCTRPNWILAQGFHPRPYRPYVGFGLVREKKVRYSPFLSCLGRSALKGSNIVGFVPWPFCTFHDFNVGNIFFNTSGIFKSFSTIHSKKAIENGPFCLIIAVSEFQVMRRQLQCYNG